MLGLSAVPAGWAAGAVAIRDGPMEVDGRAPLIHKPAAGFDSEHQSCSMAVSEVQQGVYMCFLT